MTDAVGGTLWKVGVDTSAVEKGLASTAAKSQAMGKQAGGFFDTLKGKIGGLTTSLKDPALQKGVLQGVGIGTGVLAFTGIATAIEGAANIVGDFIKGSEAAQVVDTKLAAALRANVPDWQAHTAEIESAAKAGERLGFTALQQKDALAQLLPRTHNVAEAERLLSLSMDAARLKGLDLVSTSMALGKVYSGNTGAAKRLGFVIDKNATSTQALAQIQTAAAGQAVAYSKTAQGAQAKLEASLSGFKEKVGQDLLGPFTDVVNFIAGPVLDAVEHMITGLGNIGDAFNNLHRSIDPNFAAIQDSNQALIDLADTLGISSDALIAGADKNRNYAKAVATVTDEQGKQLVIADLLAAKQANQAVDAGALADKYKQYGITTDQVLQLESDVANGTAVLTKSTDAQTIAVENAYRAALPYLLNLGLTRTQQLLNAQAADTNTTATYASKDAYYAQAEALKAAEHAHALANGTLAASTDGFGRLFTALDDLHKPLDPLQRQFGGMGDALAGVVKPARSAAGAMHHVGDELGGAGAAATAVVSQFDFMQGGVIGALKSTRTDAKSEINQLWWDIKHPGELDKNRNALKHQMERAQKALHAAEKTGDANVIQEAQALVDDLNTKWQQLNGTITITANVDAYNQSHHALLSGGRAGGGPVWPGTWMVGENGPEKLTLGRNGTGYVTPNSGGRGGNSIGPITVNVMGSVAAGEGRAMGQGIVAGLLVELGRMRTLPIGRAA
jgi:hypothetical protein